MRCWVCGWVRVLGWFCGAMLLVLGSPQPVQTPTRLLPPPEGNGPSEPLLTLAFAVPVLMYHRIAELPPGAGPLLRDLTVSPTDFERQVRYLVQNRYVILTAGQVERAVRFGLPLPVHSVALTLDDGYGDDFTEAFPILRRYGLDGTLFLVTGTIGSAGHVSWDEAREMLAERMEFGSHTVHHYDLTTLAEPELDRELTDSKEELERQLAVPIEQIAYPAGQYNAQVKEHARQAGYDAGWKKGGGWVTPVSDPLMLPRVRVRGDTTMAEFIRKVTHRLPTRWELSASDR
jgi:peptidoglycan/xylan/chitin deacetylase (PgdA/CDA1 family)